MSFDKEHILVVDDDAPLGLVLVGLLTQAGYSAKHVTSAEEGLRVAMSSRVDAVLSDLRMPGMDGIQFLREMQARAPEVPVVMLTAHDTARNAVDAMKAGAKDFLSKPFDNDEIVYTLRKVLAEGAGERPPSRAPADPSTIIAVSPAMRRTLADIRRAAASAATVLLRGESGTGKEVCARAIHEMSARRGGPFAVVNAAALPEQLLESELFGYERGAFTGAIARKPGRIELAAGGTFMLDEIGDVPAALQVKLLRLLQERAFQRLGGTKEERVDVRLVAATHQNLKEMVRRDAFREDLYYRLTVLTIEVPALRDRPEDIEPLALHFADAAGRENNHPGVRFTPAALARLHKHDWPGNVRELENLVERLVVFNDGVAIDDADVSREIDKVAGALRRSASSTPVAAPVTPAIPLPQQLQDAERKMILDTLAHAKGNRSLAARLLKISRRTLYNKLDELGIK